MRPTIPTIQTLPFSWLCAGKQTPKLGEPHRNWQAEWKWDGIRGQIISATGNYSSGRGRRADHREIPRLAALLPFCTDEVAIDGEIRLRSATAAASAHSALCRPHQEEEPYRKQLQEAPVAFLSYDLLEWNRKTSGCCRCTTGAGCWKACIKSEPAVPSHFAPHHVQ